MLVLFYLVILAIQHVNIPTFVHRVYTPDYMEIPILSYRLDSSLVGEPYTNTPTYLA